MEYRYYFGVNYEMHNKTCDNTRIEMQHYGVFIKTHLKR